MMLLALLKESSMLEQLLQWDSQILIYLNNLGTEPFDSFWQALTKFTNWIPLFLALITLIFLKNPWRKALKMMLFYTVMILSLAKLIFVTKDAVGRLRPNNDPNISDLIRVLGSPQDFSFFSGHAAASFCIATLAVLFFRKRFKWIYLLFIWPVIFSYSRIYLGLHYPSDILFGAMCGFLWAVLFCWAFQKIKVPYLG